MAEIEEILTCIICEEGFTKVKRKAIECPKCHSQVCVECIKKYMVTSSDEPHCMNCKLRFNYNFLSSYLPKTFLNKDWIKHRQTVLFDREKSMLPETLAHINEEKERKKIRDEAIKKINELRLKCRKLRCPNTECDNVIIERGYRCKVCKTEVCSNCKEKVQPDICVYAVDCEEKLVCNKYNEYNIRLQELWDIYNGVNDGENKKEKRRFIMPCPNDNCRGFLSEKYKCGICEAKICKDCHEVKEEEHVCDEDNVLSVENKKKNCKKCPTCGTYIYRIHGCNSMWCTNCKVGFNWATGKINTRTQVDNPHYYEWMRTRNRENNVGVNMLCGQDIRWELILDVKVRKFARKEFEIMSDIRYRIIPAYTVDINRENEMLRERYLKGKLTEEQWKRKLALKEREYSKYAEIREIAEMYVTVSEEYLGRLETAITIGSTFGDMHVKIRKWILNLLDNYHEDKNPMRIKNTKDTIRIVRNILKSLIKNKWYYAYNKDKKWFGESFGYRPSVPFKNKPLSRVVESFTNDLKGEESINKLYDRLLKLSNKYTKKSAYEEYCKTVKDILELRVYFNKNMRRVSEVYNKTKTVHIYTFSGDSVYVSSNTTESTYKVQQKLGNIFTGDVTDEYTDKILA